jgi:phosphoserine phosphatase RsbU/P
MPARRTLLPLVGVAALFLIAVGFQIRFTVESIDTQLHLTKRARLPFTISHAEGKIARAEPETKQAGLADGDQPVEVDHHRIRGMGGLAETIREHRAGDSVNVVATRDGRPILASIRLAAISEKPLPAREWIAISFLNYLTPWFCIALGFFVAFIRPRDLLAWLLLMLMLSFSQVAQGDAFRSMLQGWHGWIRPLAMFYFTALNGSWGLWMMLFGQYFPDRVANGFWDRMARWVLGVPIVALSILVPFVNALVLEDATALGGLQRVLTRSGPVLMMMMMVAIATFFINISLKASFSKNVDAKRRLKLLYGGAMVSLTPLFLLVMASLIFRIKNVPDWILLPTLMLLFLFPVTLAYVIVVEKAMELRVVVRQGLRYALASKGVRVVQVIVSAAVITGALYMATSGGLRRPQQIQMLGFGVLFVVLARRVSEKVRAWVDRRFFRESVDMERVLAELSENVRSIVEVGPLLQTVTETISNALHVPRVAALVQQNGDYAPAYALGYDAAQAPVRFSKNSVVLERLRGPLRVSLTRSWEEDDRKRLERLGTELLLPLAVKNRLLGFLSLGPKLSEEPYSATDVRLLESVAAQTGLALENSRLTEAVASEVAQRERLNRELEIAREVQQRLFPQRGPKIENLDYAGKCRPASSVGGDYYDFVAMCDGRMGIAIGDISGKGVPAALLMASLQASLRGLAIANPPELASLMTNLNRLIYDASPSNRYATFFYGVYNPKSREFLYVNGGHNAPMVFRRAEVLRLERGGPVVGLFGPAQYREGSIQLERGDTMVLFTDGVSEAMTGADEEFDEPRLIESVRAGASLNANDLIDHIMRDCDHFVAGAPQHDDMTLVVVRVV